jgi:glutamate 5-kinase
VKESQMLASVGQARLIEAYRQAFEEENIVIGQVLLTHRELSDRASYINAHHTIMAMWEHGVLPVLNENDAVGYEEICFGDNDQLAALVSAMVEANLLTIITVTDGVFTANPNIDAGAKRISLVDDFEGLDVNFKGSSSMGSGGMKSKVSAAQIACEAGTAVVVTNQPLNSILQGEDLGTFFRPHTILLEKRRHWLRYGLKEKGSMCLDSGASKALAEHGASILPIGVTSVEGDFQRGDVIAIYGSSGDKLACGLAEYPSVEMRKILGRHSNEIEALLGYRYLDVVVHRDDLVLEKN